MPRNSVASFFLNLFKRLKPTARPGHRQRRSVLPSRSQWNYLFRLLSSTERRIVTIGIVLILVSLFVLAVRLYHRHIVIEPAHGGTYTEALIGAPQTINPLYGQTNDVDQDLVSLIYSSLFRLDPAGGLAPDLVATYELSEDQKTYTLHLREDVYWHDGQPVTANDVLFTISAIQTPGYGSPLAGNLTGVQAQRVDDYSLTLTLSEPFAPFLANLTFGILPEHIWSDIDVANVRLVEYNLKPIGSGPFRFASLTRDRTGTIKSYTVTPNERYLPHPPYLETLTFRFYPDITTAVEAASNKNVEGISFITNDLTANIGHKDIVFKKLGLPQYTALFFQQKKNDRLKDLNVRSALDRAINKQAIIDTVLAGDAKTVSGPILPGFIGYNPAVDIRAYDPAQAATLLDESGWKIPDGGTVRAKAGRELAFSLTTVDQPQLLQTAEMIKADWEAIGARVELVTVNSAQAQRDVIKPREYDILLYGEIIGLDPDPYPFWHSSQQTDPGLALAIFFNKQADKVLEQARQTSDENQRNLKYIEFQNIIAAEIPAVFLYSPSYTYGLAKKVQGFTLQNITMPSDRFTSAADWYIKTKRVWH